MRKIVFVNDENQTEYKDIPANVFDAVEHLMVTYGDIYKDISREKIDCEHTDCNNCVNHKYCDYESTTKNDSPKYCDRSICLKNEYNNVGCEDCEVTKSQEPTTKNCESCRYYGLHHEVCNYCYKCSLWTEQEPTTKNNLGVREFVEIVVEYPPEDLCTYPEYKGKPYFSIKYEEGNDCIIGYGTYNPQVLSRYLKDYFMPTTKNDLGVDCIKKSDAINIIQDMRGLARADVISDAVNRIITMPSVTPQEPKTGKWINTETKGVRYAFWCRYKCSLCGGLSDHTNFCPNCGAKMESEDKE